MNEAEVSGFVSASPTDVERSLSPATIVEYEGSFRVVDVNEVDGATVVTVAASGLEFGLRFEPTADGYRYEQVAGGPLDAMTTELTWAPEDHGTEVRFRSAVSAGLPFAPLTDRIAAWKRRGELNRALRNLRRDLE